MITPKTQAELEIMIEGGKRLKRVKEALRDAVKPGVTPLELDQMAEKLIKEEGGDPCFKKVRGYHWSTCINLNDGVVHGIPTPTPIVEGDLVSVDVGMMYKGFNTDTSFTVPAGSIDKDTQKFLEVGRIALKKAIEATRVGNRISQISRAMQEVLEEAGYTPVRALTGHGVGKKLHEEPQIPCFWPGDLGSGEVIPERAVFAVEAIYCLGKSDLIISGEDKWTISTKDGKIAGLFEETVAVTEKGPLVLTA
jgi:methionyl aminopeptidase